MLPQDAAPAAPNSPALRSLEVQPLSNAFAAQLFQRLRDHDPETTPALAWLHRTLAAQHKTADDVVHSEHQRQGAVNLSVRNIITSLRLISSVDWAKFFESVSLVDELLRERSAFAAFDFPTRDLYRHAIEDLSRRSRHTEIDVAERALNAAGRTADRVAAAAHAAAADRARAAEPAVAPVHALEAGYYLLSAGRLELEQELGYRIPWNQRIARWMRASGAAGYAGSIAALSFAMTLALVLGAGTPASGIGMAIAIALLALLAASDVAAAIVNLCVNRFCNPTVLPALELLDGVPPELRTVVAVPVLLTGTTDIEEFVRRLEVHYLATQDGDIRFALLSDWIDSTTETLPGDADLLAAAAAGIARLNRTHGGINGEERFLLLHRRRLWNELQGNGWVGSESAASCSSSTACCAGPRTPASCPSRAVSPACPAAFDT